MPVSLPTAQDVRKAREQAARAASERAEVARTPLLAVLGAGEYTVTAVSRAVAEADLRARAVQHRVAELPQRLRRPEGLRRTVTELRAEAEERYGDLAERGELAWGRIRQQPQVKQVISTIETYTGKLDARVDVLVDDAHDAAEKALRTVTRQTRSTGEKVARTTQQVAAEAAEAVTDVAEDASEAVAKAGDELAENITEAGGEVAHDVRSASRKAAERTAPKVEPKVVRKATRRTTHSSSNSTAN